MRDEWMMMSRIRNEARWIARNLHRTFQCVRTVVLWNDASTDETEREVTQALLKLGVEDGQRTPWGWIISGKSLYGEIELHWVNSPFRPARRTILEVSEIRDKQALWEYVKSNVLFTHVLCLDGDEMLSQALIAHFGHLETRFLEGADILHIPFIYLWNNESTRRVDGIYGAADDGLPRFRVPRAFTIARVDEYDLFEQRFAWEGHRQGRQVLGGFHCGSIPRENFRIGGGVRDLMADTIPWPIIHFGYLYDADRQAKFKFYNRIDPGNVFEGEYRHMVEIPNIHAPGPTLLVPYEDAP